MFKLHTGIICAAGVGSRVRGVLGNSTSKEMVQVWGKPALQHHLDMMLKLKGFNDVVVVTNSKKRDIIDYMFANFDNPQYRQLIQNTNVVGHTVFTHLDTKVDSPIKYRTDGTEAVEPVAIPIPKKTRVHLIVLAHDKIGQNPIESMQAAYNVLGMGDFYSSDAFISFADIVIENMAEDLSYQVNCNTTRGLNYISALSRESEQDTLRIEKCGRFSLECTKEDSTDNKDYQVKNLTSVLSNTDNTDTCTHMDLGFYYGSTRTLFRTAGTWVYDRMSTSLLPIHPMPIRVDRKIVDLGDPETYLCDFDLDLHIRIRPETPIQHVELNMVLSNNE